MLACGALSDQGLNPRLLRCQADALPLSCQERTCLLEVLGVAATELNCHLSLLLSLFLFYSPSASSLTLFPLRLLTPTFPSFIYSLKILTLSSGACIRCSSPIKSDASVGVCKRRVWSETTAWGFLAGPVVGTPSLAGQGSRVRSSVGKPKIHKPRSLSQKRRKKRPYVRITSA